jgi:hypothetical protein
MCIALDPSTKDVFHRALKPELEAKGWKVHGDDDFPYITVG